jgi:hypothetical protein
MRRIVSLLVVAAALVFGPTAEATIPPQAKRA